MRTRDPYGRPLILQHCPGQEHWAVAEVQVALVSLKEFRQHWKVSHSEIARLTGAPVKTVQKWSCLSSRQRPGFEHLYRLTVIHRRWLEISRQGGEQ